MVNGFKIIYLRGLNKGFTLRFCVGSRVQHEAPNEGRRTYCPKRCEYNNDDEGNIPNILRDKNYQVSSQKFTQILFYVATKYHINS